MNRHVPIPEVYKTLFESFGPQHWWPGRTRLEVVIGAILTQNTAWTNIEKVIRRLKKEKGLNLHVLHQENAQTIAEWIKPAGYFNVKAKRIKAFVDTVFRGYGGRLEKLFTLETSLLRQVLLHIHGIGPETADSILLYAAKRPVFVVDAYTRRFLSRHGWIHSDASYDEIARLFESKMGKDVQTYNEYHALIVQLGKSFCKTKPLCENCPLHPWLNPV
ncbi:MAG: endonuclease III domain-containing protein [Kiritimatiellae bacterium]|nr:endonuclease III domain-containing protein [Kiritimatiellia bacterium]